MDADTVISVEGLGKRYVIGHEVRHDTLRDTLAHGARGLLQRLVRPGVAASREEFWALQDVSFEVKRGDVVGIIGRNGAGKSTLLKVLSRITEPTAGRAVIRGRVASLLEVGTGFHPELTGRENIFLNGAILGMRREEIRRKFDEIVAFAEVERFLDTPVKYYSSGMYVRLAFAVAAHLEPEILIVDEVLAVGDAAFQKKCLGRMGEVSRSGRTVLFVSHNLEAIQATCRSGILLAGGRLRSAGPVAEVASLYRDPHERHARDYPVDAERPCISRIELNPLALGRGSLEISLHYESPFPLDLPNGGLVLSTADGRPLFGTNMRLQPPPQIKASRKGVCRLSVTQLPLHSGTYCVAAWLGDSGRDYDTKPEALVFTLSPEKVSPAAARSHALGPLDLPCAWDHLPASS